MKMLRNSLLLVLAAVIFGCGASQKVKEPNAELDRMMEQKAFEISIRSAEPQLTQAMGQIANSGIMQPGNTIGRIDVAGSGYFIKIDGDSVSADLPYYGERQMGGGYNSDSGIKFDGIGKNLEITKDDLKQSYTLGFSIASNSENYIVRIEVGNNMTSTSNIRSSHRNRIRYSGDVEALAKRPHSK